MNLTNIKESYDKNIKSGQLKNNLETIRKENKKKIDKEIRKTVKDLGKNRIKITEKNRTGEIKLNVTTNRRTLAVGASALVINALTIGLLARKIKSSKKTEPETRIDSIKKVFAK